MLPLIVKSAAGLLKNTLWETFTALQIILRVGFLMYMSVQGQTPVIQCPLWDFLYASIAKL